MELFKEYFDSELICEMSNINPKDHNLGIDIKLHILQPGNKQLQHGPRIKCIKRNSNFDFSISLNVDVNKIMLIGDYAPLISTKEYNILLNYIKKYRIPFLNMWYDPYMDQHELFSQMEELDGGFEVALVLPTKNKV